MQVRIDCEEEVICIQTDLALNKDSSLLDNFGLNSTEFSPAWGNKKLNQYFPVSEIERQVYLDAQKIFILTNNRLVKLI